APFPLQGRRRDSRRSTSMSATTTPPRIGLIGSSKPLSRIALESSQLLAPRNPGRARSLITLSAKTHGFNSRFQVFETDTRRRSAIETGVACRHSFDIYSPQEARAQRNAGKHDVAGRRPDHMEEPKEQPLTERWVAIATWAFLALGILIRLTRYLVGY